MKAQCSVSARPSKLETRGNFISLPLAKRTIVIYTPKSQIGWNILWQETINCSLEPLRDGYIRKEAARMDFWGGRQGKQARVGGERIPRASPSCLVELCAARGCLVPCIR